MRFTLLGSGAVRNNPRRAGPAQIVHVGEQRFLFDCGRGACLRLAQQDEKVEEIDRLFLTHLHFDHICDLPLLLLLSALCKLWRGTGRCRSVRRAVVDEPRGLLLNGRRIHRLHSRPCRHWRAAAGRGGGLGW